MYQTISAQKIHISRILHVYCKVVILPLVSVLQWPSASKLNIECLNTLLSCLRKFQSQYSLIETKRKRVTKTVLQWLNRSGLKFQRVCALLGFKLDFLDRLETFPDDHLLHRSVHRQEVCQYFLLVGTAWFHRFWSFEYSSWNHYCALVPRKYAVSHRGMIPCFSNYARYAKGQRFLFEMNLII